MLGVPLRPGLLFLGMPATRLLLMIPSRLLLLATILVLLLRQ
jgi:hypothetical protein